MIILIEKLTTYLRIIAIKASQVVVADELPLLYTLCLSFLQVHVNIFSF